MIACLVLNREGIGEWRSGGCARWGMLRRDLGAQGGRGGYGDGGVSGRVGVRRESRFLRWVGEVGLEILEMQYHAVYPCSMWSCHTVSYP